MTELITSPANPLIKQARALRQKKNRDESGLFLAEGILHVGEAADAGWDFEALLYSHERLKSDFGRGLAERLEKKGVRCAQVSEAAFDSVAEKENPSGIAAIVRQKRRGLVDFPNFELAVALVSPQDPGNVGTILRSIDAVGADGLILLEGGSDPYHPSAVRASMGTVFSTLFVSAGFDEFSAWRSRRGIRLLGTSAHATLDYRTVSLDKRPTVLLLGSEQKGLTPEQSTACDELLSLPMRGRASSLNLAVAAGVFLYALKG